MQDDKKYLFEEFEKEVFLYIEGSLPADRMEFWESKIGEDDEIRKLYNDNILLMGSFDSLTNDDISDEKFDAMIEKAVSYSGVFHKLKIWGARFKAGDEKNGLNWSRIALGASFIVAAISIWIISNRPLPVSEIDSDLLDWSGSQINSKIEELEGMIYTIRNEEAKNQELNRRSMDKWDPSYYIIERSLKEIKKDVKSESL